MTLLSAGVRHRGPVWITARRRRTGAVTTARFWPEWHPATRGVEGDTGLPARLGDQITEQVTIAGIQGPGTWTAVEHDRPHHLAMENDLAFGHLRISYQLTPVDGESTRFQRDLDFPELGPQVSATMQAQSTEGITSLASLVQRELPAPRAATIEQGVPVRQACQDLGERPGLPSAITTSSGRR